MLKLFPAPPLPCCCVAFESILDWDAFSIRIKQESIPHIPEILAAVSDDQVGGQGGQGAQGGGCWEEG